MALMRRSQHIVGISVEPNTEADHEKLAQALPQLLDPAVGISRDAQTGRTVLTGTNELALEFILGCLKDRFKVDLKVGEPKVLYRETVTRKAEGEGRYVHKSGGLYHYAHVGIWLEPGDAGSGCMFGSKSVGDLIPEAFIAAIDEGIKEQLVKGAAAGFPVDDVRVEVFDGSYHEVDSSEEAFKIAGAMAFHDALEKAGPMVTEPIMQVELAAPEGLIGEVVGDLTSRRGRIEGVQRKGTIQVIRSRVPLAEMLGYARELRSQTHGRATCSIRFDRYEPVSGGLDPDSQDGATPVAVPRTPRPGGKNSGAALPMPE